MFLKRFLKIGSKSWQGKARQSSFGYEHLLKMTMLAGVACGVTYAGRSGYDSMFRARNMCDDKANDSSNRDPRRDPLGRDEDPLFRSRHNQPLLEDIVNNSGKTKKLQKAIKDLVIITGNSNRPLAEEVVAKLGTRLGEAKVGKFSDGETFIRIDETVRGKDVFVIQSTCPPVNENLMELLLLISTLRRASAKSITAVIPYYGYARQDRKTESRVSIAAADVAKLLETMGVDRVIAIDLHCGQIQGFFGPNVPVDNIAASLVGLEHMLSNVDDLDNFVVVSPDAGGVRRAKLFQEMLIRRGFQNVSLAMIVKQRAEAGKIAQMDLIGSVEGKDCIILDDMIDTAGTLCKAAQGLKDKGAKRVYAFATHGVFSHPAAENIRDSTLEKVLITNSVPLSQEFKDIVPKEKYDHLSIATLIAETIRRIYLKESVSSIFEPAKTKRSEQIS